MKFGEPRNRPRALSDARLLVDIEDPGDEGHHIDAQPHNASGKLPGGSPASHVEWVFRWLDRPVHSSTLCLFRAMYSLVMVSQFLKWWHIFEDFQVGGEGRHFAMPQASP